MPLPLSESLVYARRLADLLRGFWRPGLPPVNPRILDDRLTAALVNTGTGGLLWRRMAGLAPLNAECCQTFQSVYRTQTLDAGRYQMGLRQIIVRLQSVGINPILAKGWAGARLYPEPTQRPCGDIDLLVPPHQLTEAKNAVRNLKAHAVPIDWHTRFWELEDFQGERIERRLEPLAVGDVTVRTLGPEHHLRLVCLHFLRHGAWRPLWLCDIAVALENRPMTFDWQECLNGNARRTDWMICALQAAHELLGMSLEGCPAVVQERKLPSWLVPAILRQWAVPYLRYRNPRPMRSYLLNPIGMMEAMKQRWPNPIEATIGVKGPFNILPRWPFQIADVVNRMIHFGVLPSGGLPD